MTPDADGDLRVNRSLVIPASELEWRFSGSGGPGGQHANTANTKAEVRFDIEGSTALGPRQRERLLAKLGPEVRVTSSETRSQSQNRNLALGRLRERLAAALVVETPRRATKPTKGSKLRRVETKRQRSEVKKARQRPRRDD
jgi:ribosome-associated protein